MFIHKILINKQNVRFSEEVIAKGGDSPPPHPSIFLSFPLEIFPAAKPPLIQSHAMSSNQTPSTENLLIYITLEFS